jgi:hypothetical protein
MKTDKHEDVNVDLAQRIQDIRAALDVLIEPGSPVELRVPGARFGTASGVFDDLDQLALAAAQHSGTAPGVFITLNPVERSATNSVQVAHEATADCQIARRVRLGIDFDPVRMPKTSSTGEEHDAALERARTCREWLRANGWPEPMLNDSGNGAHLVYRIDLPSDGASRTCVKKCLAALASRFSDAIVEVDTTTFNASRIWKLPGTLVCKGANTSERPHRLSRVLETPIRLEVVPRELLEKLAAMAPEKAQGAAQPIDTGEKQDLEPARPAEKLLTRLAGVQTSGNGWTARCPAHNDHSPSLSISEAEDGKVLVKCFAGCAVEAVVAKLGLEMRDLFPTRELVTGGNHGSNGITLAEYAEAKRLPESFLTRLGVGQFSYQKKLALRIPYLDASRKEVAVRFRIGVACDGSGGSKFRWRKGDKPCPYGLWRLSDARAANFVVLCEGESDAQTLWHHGFPALAIPGASTWREEWSEHLAGIATIYAVIEPDQGGQAMLAWLAKSGIRDRVHLLRLDGCKDPSGLHVADPDGFSAAFRVAMSAATSWADHERVLAEERRREAWEQCHDIASKPRILDAFAEDLRRRGLAGETDAAKLLYLAITSRLFDRPVSVAVKGPSGGGKSYLTEQVLSFFPAEAYHALSAMSERALVYSAEPLSHRMLVIYEAAGIQGDFGTYLIRSLLSEGRVRYETVEATDEGWRPRLLEREGPTGLIVTTTAASLHPENETRLLSILVTDTPEQTSAVFRALATEEAVGSAVDLEAWRSFQVWLQTGTCDVTIPYGEVLADLMFPVAVRLRRDFGALLTLVRAHALLHQASRSRDERGRIVATLEDYDVVRELVQPLIAHGSEAAVSATMRETVEVVQDVYDTAGTEVQLVVVAKSLGIDKSAASRRVKAALNVGYLHNREERSRRPMRLVPGEPLPDGVELLPLVEAVAAKLAESSALAQTVEAASWELDALDNEERDEPGEVYEYDDDGDDRDDPADTYALDDEDEDRDDPDTCSYDDDPQASLGMYDLDDDPDGDYSLDDPSDDEELDQ